MPIDLEKYQRLKRKADEAKTTHDRAVGALEEQTKSLKTDFEVDSLEAGETLHSKLLIEEQAAETEYNTALQEFESTWKEKLL